MSLSLERMPDTSLIEEVLWRTYLVISNFFEDKNNKKIGERNMSVEKASLRLSSNDASLDCLGQFPRQLAAGRGPEVVQAPGSVSHAPQPSSDSDDASLDCLGQFPRRLAAERRSEAVQAPGSVSHAPQGDETAVSGKRSFRVLPLVQPSSDSDDASLECLGRFPQLVIERGQSDVVQGQRGKAPVLPGVEIFGSGKSPSPVPSRLSPRPSLPVSPVPERDRFEGRNTVWTKLEQPIVRPQAISVDGERLLANLQSGFLELARKMESVFYDRIVEIPSKEIGPLLQECADEKKKLMRNHSAIHEYIRQNMDRMTRDAAASTCHTVIVSKAESGLPHALRWSVSLNKSSGVWTSTCYITRGELGRGGEAIVKEVIACSAKVFQRMAIRHLVKAEKELQPSPLSTEVQRSRQVEQMEFVDVLTKRGVPRLVQMKQLLYLGKDGVMKEGMAMECYSSYYDVVITSTEEMMPKLIRIAALLGETLYYLHKQGFVHRDLKLENILIDDHYVPFLGDFGLTRRSGAITGSRGTVGYRPPEILEVAGERKIPADPRSDLWSFGVLLYISFLKTNPFEAIQIEHREAVLAGDTKRKDRLFREFCGLVEQERETLLTGQYSPRIDIELGPVIADLLDLHPANRMAEDTMLTLLQRVAKRYTSQV